MFGWKERMMGGWKGARRSEILLFGKREERREGEGWREMLSLRAHKIASFL